MSIEKTHYFKFLPKRKLEDFMTNLQQIVLQNNKILNKFDIGLELEVDCDCFISVSVYSLNLFFLLKICCININDFKKLMQVKC